MTATALPAGFDDGLIQAGSPPICASGKQGPRRAEGILSTGLTRFLGDTPLRVALKLAVVSLIVGVVMNAMGWSPFDVIEEIRGFFVGIWNLGFDTLGRFASYMLLGAAIVVPAFLILRLASFRR
jgi:hypothetical protein